MSSIQNRVPGRATSLGAVAVASDEELASSGQCPRPIDDACPTAQPAVLGQPRRAVRAADGTSTTLAAPGTIPGATLDALPGGGRLGHLDQHVEIRWLDSHAAVGFNCPEAGWPSTSELPTPLAPHGLGQRRLVRGAAPADHRTGSHTPREPSEMPRMAKPMRLGRGSCARAGPPGPVLTRPRPLGRLVGGRRACSFRRSAGSSGP